MQQQRVDDGNDDNIRFAEFPIVGCQQEQERIGILDQMRFTSQGKCKTIAYALLTL